MLRRFIILSGLLSLLCSIAVQAQSDSPQGTAPASFDSAAASLQQQLEESLAELTRLREQIAESKIPMSRRLSDLEAELIEVRAEFNKVTRERDNTILGLNAIQNDIKARQEQTAYLSNLLGEYIRNFQSRLHVAETNRFSELLDEAIGAPEQPALSEAQVFEKQAALVAAAIDRMFDAMGGTRFEGSAVDPGELVRRGSFHLLGPAAIFMTEDQQLVGAVEQRMGEPAVVPFATPEDASAALQVASASVGSFPLDPTLGNASKIEATEETWLEHVKKGGPVMYPIFALAGAAFLVAMYKWLCFLFVRKPSRRKVAALLRAVSHHDREGVERTARSLRGPAGAMLRAGVEHIDEPRELIEEVMYEKVLATRLKLQRMLPFMAISAAAAPLLGLLGTVTGIIYTFKLITLFGTGDVKTLSAGISEALITTEYGLIVAIPSLVLHAFLSRKARAIVDQMEKVGVSFVNQVSKSKFGPKAAEIAQVQSPAAAPMSAPTSGGATEAQVRAIVSEMFEPVLKGFVEGKGGRVSGNAESEVPETGSRRREVVTAEGKP